MELQYYGGNCVRITTKSAGLVVDDNLGELGLKTITKEDEVLLYTVHDDKEKPKSRLLIADPGEYEVSGVSIRGVAARAHMDGPDQKSATIYKIDYDELRIAVVGHIYPDLSEDQLEAIGTVDVLIVPVGGNGFTLDGVGALGIIKKIEPKLVIPTHYADSKLNYKVPQADLSEALKNMSMEPSQEVPKLKIKPADFGEATQLIVLERQ
jgi:L-ascorbate metabolism protein UlaG (beta-lactamase superfamily)